MHNFGGYWPEAYRSGELAPTFGVPWAPWGSQPSTTGRIPGMEGRSTGPREPWRPLPVSSAMSWGAPPKGYGAPPMGFGAPPKSFGAPPMGFGAPAMGYGAPPRGYGTPFNNFGAPPMGYGAPPIAHGPPLPPRYLLPSDVRDTPNVKLKYYCVTLKWTAHASATMNGRPKTGLDVRDK